MLSFCSRFCCRESSASLRARNLYACRPAIYLGVRRLRLPARGGRERIGDRIGAPLADGRIRSCSEDRGRERRASSVARRGPSARDPSGKAGPDAYVERPGCHARDIGKGRYPFEEARPRGQDSVADPISAEHRPEIGPQAALPSGRWSRRFKRMSISRQDFASASHVDPPDADTCGRAADNAVASISARAMASSGCSAGSYRLKKRWISSTNSSVCWKRKP